MRTIAIFNHKGGVGKTTTAVNLAAGLSRKNKRVLLVDLDPQGNVDTSLKLKAEYNIYDAATGKLEVQQCVINLADNFDILTSKETLVQLETLLSRQQDSELLVKEMLKKINGYDYMILDCPPSLGMLNQNALAFSKEAFVPVSTDYLGYDALKKMYNIIDRINVQFHHDLKITKIIPTMFDRRNKICKEMLLLLQQEYPEQLSYPVRYNTKLKEAPMHGKSIFSYAKKSPGAQDYGKLVEDVLNMPAS